MVVKPLQLLRSSPSTCIQLWRWESHQQEELDHSCVPRQPGVLMKKTSRLVPQGVWWTCWRRRKPGFLHGAKLLFPCVTQLTLSWKRLAYLDNVDESPTLCARICYLGKWNYGGFFLAIWKCQKFFKLFELLCLTFLEITLYFLINRMFNF